MKNMGNTIAAGLFLLVTVSGGLGCETRALTGGGDPTSAATTPAEGTPAVGGADAAMAATASDAATVPSPALVQEVMRRWNAAVDSGTATIDFHWSQVNEFPHPTFKGGTPEAYGQFAAVLLAFFQQGDDFDFLAANHLFTMEVRDDTVSGVGDEVTSFEALADSFSSPTAFGDIAPDVHDGLVQVAARIHQAE
jgi:hypothetical protein